MCVGVCYNVVTKAVKYYYSGQNDDEIAICKNNAVHYLPQKKRCLDKYIIIMLSLHSSFSFAFYVVLQALWVHLS